MILHRYGNVSPRRMKNLAFLPLNLFPLDGFSCNLCSLHNLNTLWNIFMIIHECVEVMMICGVEIMTILAFLRFDLFPLHGLSCDFVASI